MNPLDLRGPEFLAFYLVYGAAVLGAAWTIRLFLLSSGGPAAGAPRWSAGVYPREGDAYGIALLRGGPQEVVRAVLGSLVSSELMRVEDRTLRPAHDGPPPRLSPIESEAFAALSAASGGIDAAAAEAIVRRAVEPYLAGLQEELERQGLTVSGAQVRSCERLRLLALLALLGLAAAKLAVALSRGRTNVGFLVVLAAGYAVAAFFVLKPPERTRAGSRYLDWLQESHQGLVNLLSRGRRDAVGERALVAGIYGLQVLPTAGALQEALRPKASAGQSGGGGCCGGGGDSEGIGDIGGGGDGGGGCGGGGCGGGGCGGCGS